MSPLRGEMRRHARPENSSNPSRKAISFPPASFAAEIQLSVGAIGLNRMSERRNKPERIFPREKPIADREKERERERALAKQPCNVWIRRKDSPARIIACFEYWTDTVNYATESFDAEPRRSADRESFGDLVVTYV